MEALLVGKEADHRREVLAVSKVDLVAKDGHKAVDSKADLAGRGVRKEADNRADLAGRGVRKEADNRVDLAERAARKAVAFRVVLLPLAFQVKASHNPDKDST